MKKIILIPMSLLLVFLSSCSLGKSENTNMSSPVHDSQEIPTESAVQKEETTLEYGTAAEILSREIKDYSDVKVKEHDYRALVLMEKLPDILKYNHEYYRYYSNSQTEELYNLINAKDKDTIISRFSPETQEEEGSMLGRKIDVLFKYIDGPIVDYDEDDRLSAEVYASYGEIIWVHKYYQGYFYTESGTKYRIWIYYSIKDETDDKVGITEVSVVTDEIDNYDIEHSLSDYKYKSIYNTDQTGIECFTKEGVIEVN